MPLLYFVFIRDLCARTPRAPSRALLLLLLLLERDHSLGIPERRETFPHGALRQCATPWQNALVVKSGLERFYECFGVHTLRYSRPRPARGECISKIAITRAVVAEDRKAASRAFFTTESEKWRGRGD
jgi:hypothetical protein